MSKKRHIIFTVTNDLNYDQRMIRICTSLVNAGYRVTLVGFKRKNSNPLTNRPYKQVRLPIIAEKGKWLYASYWFNLFFYLTFRRTDAYCAIDLDTILPVYFASIIRNKRRIYDAHELFTELKEVVTKPFEKKIWDRIESFTLPSFHFNYTIGHFYALYFRQKYGKEYSIIRNATILTPFTIPEKQEKYILYQGWVNEGRCFEELIPAMKYVDCKLIICGEGNFYKQAVALTHELELTDKIIFKGFVPPDELKSYTEKAYVGITLFHAISKSNEYSLANRYFDYMHHGVPQLCMNFPEYKMMNQEYEVAILIDNPATPEDIAAALNKLLRNDNVYNRLQANAMKAREKYNWQREEEKLVEFYQHVFSHKKKYFK